MGTNVTKKSKTPDIIKNRKPQGGGSRKGSGRPRKIVLMKLKKDIPEFRRVQDFPEIQIKNNDIGFALKILRRRAEASGIFKARKLREKFPNRKDRARWKRKQATKRCIRNQKWKNERRN
jgi:ribosomal protein S21